MDEVRRVLQSARQARTEHLMKGFGAQETEDDLEKARNVGEMHSNGKWVWTEYKPGKFDWRTAKAGDKAAAGLNKPKSPKEAKMKSLAEAYCKRFDLKLEEMMPAGFLARQATDSKNAEGKSRKKYSYAGFLVDTASGDVSQATPSERTLGQLKKKLKAADDKVKAKIDAAKGDGKKKDVTDLKAGDFATVVKTGETVKVTSINGTKVIVETEGRGSRNILISGLEHDPKATKVKGATKDAVNSKSDDTLEGIMSLYHANNSTIKDTVKNVLKSMQREPEIYDFLKELNDTTSARILVTPSMRGRGLDVEQVHRSYYGSQGDKRAEKAFAKYDEIFAKYDIKTRINYSISAESSATPAAKKLYLSMKEIKDLTSKYRERTV